MVYIDTAHPKVARVVALPNEDGKEVFDNRNGMSVSKAQSSSSREGTEQTTVDGLEHGPVCTAAANSGSSAAKSQRAS
jgi:hypothetical protein